MTAKSSSPALFRSTFCISAPSALPLGMILASEGLAAADDSACMEGLIPWTTLASQLTLYEPRHVIVETYLTGPLILAPSHSPVQPPFRSCPDLLLCKCRR